MTRKFSLFVALSSSILLSLLVFSCSGNQEYTIQQKTLDNTDSLISVQATYLELASPSEELNHWFTQLNATIYREISTRKDTIAYYSAADRRRLEETSWPPYELFVNDTVYLANKNFVSVLYSIYSFTGGAHGMTEFIGYNYDLINRKDLKASDLFKPESAPEINKLLADCFQNPDGCFSDLPTLEQVSAVNLACESIIFTYGQYVLGPYSCGPASITVPLEALKPFLLLDLNLRKE